MTDKPEDEEKPEDQIKGRDWRNHAEMITQMTKEAQRVARRTGAEACIVICMFKDGDSLRFQDAGQFPMPPDHFYHVMQNAHKQGQLGHNNPKASKIIKPH